MLAPTALVQDEGCVAHGSKTVVTGRKGTKARDYGISRGVHGVGRLGTWAFGSIDRDTGETRT